MITFPPNIAFITSNVILKMNIDEYKFIVDTEYDFLKVKFVRWAILVIVCHVRYNYFMSFSPVSPMHFALTISC